MGVAAVATVRSDEGILKPFSRTDRGFTIGANELRLWVTSRDGKGVRTGIPGRHDAGRLGPAVPVCRWADYCRPNGTRRENRTLADLITGILGNSNVIFTSQSPNRGQG